MNPEEIQAIYRDEFGVEAVTLQWDGESFLTVLRGIECFLDGFYEQLEMVEGAAIQSPPFRLNKWGDLRGYWLTMCFPLRLALDTGTISGELIIQTEKSDRLDPKAPILKFEVWVDGAVVITERGDSAEDDRLRLFGKLTHFFHIRPECCLTCAFSDFYPGYGAPLYCFQEVGEEYVQVRGAAAMSMFLGNFQPTEGVHEFYRCDRFQLRIPGTGYRG